MTEKLTLKTLSGELETLRARVLELESELERKLETTLEKAVTKLGARIESRKMPTYGTSTDAEHRQRMIEKEAYLIAERRGFQGGDSAEDWAMAEKLVNDRLMQAEAPKKPAAPRKRPATKKAGSKATGLAK
ncbi:MAG: DUF2934 domain-containing protein [Gammaproteobacteria bacterium]